MDTRARFAHAKGKGAPGGVPLLSDTLTILEETGNILTRDCLYTFPEPIQPIIDLYKCL